MNNITPPESVVLLGAGGLVHIMYWHLRAAWPNTKVAIIDEYIDKNEVDFGETRIGIIKDWNLDEARLAAFGDRNVGFKHFLLAVTEPKYKKSFVEKALAKGLKPAPTLIHPSAILDGADIRIGDGGFVVAGAIIHPAARLEEYATVTTRAVVGHHCHIGKYATLNPGAIALGFVTLGEGAQLGAGTTVRGYLSIAPWVTTGMGAAVAKDLDVPGGVYVGVPAKLRQPAQPGEARGDA
ncbi:MAG: hypothetical protein RLZZ303_2758 [Candidatus Hydrogenedentota bacterium]